jgi:hypothetical protein
MDFAGLNLKWLAQDYSKILSRSLFTTQMHSESLSLGQMWWGFRSPAYIGQSSINKEKQSDEIGEPWGAPATIGANENKSSRQKIAKTKYTALQTLEKSKTLNTKNYKIKEKCKKQKCMCKKWVKNTFFQNLKILNFKTKRINVKNYICLKLKKYLSPKKSK